MTGPYFDIAHMLAGGLVLVSFLLLYQDRMFALLNVFALHAVVLSASVAWQAHIQAADHLYVPAAIALVLKAVIIPVALRRVVIHLGIHRTIENVTGVGPTMLAGMGLVGLSMVVMLKATSPAVAPLSTPRSAATRKSTFAPCVCSLPAAAWRLSRARITSTRRHSWARCARRRPTPGCACASSTGSANPRTTPPC